MPSHEPPFSPVFPGSSLSSFAPVHSIVLARRRRGTTQYVEFFLKAVERCLMRLIGHQLEPATPEMPLAVILQRRGVDDAGAGPILPFQTLTTSKIAQRLLPAHTAFGAPLLRIVRLKVVEQDDA